jgi:hypothetical protein
MGKFKEFMQDQIKEIEKHLENEKKAGKLVNDDTMHEWIKEESESFRKRWEKDHT